MEKKKEEPVKQPEKKVTVTVTKKILKEVNTNTIELQKEKEEAEKVLKNANSLDDLILLNEFVKKGLISQEDLNKKKK
eukprot:EC821594.1.p1 GENE.EC821594.1~~EC821594.1.p1  ORF type:complete len:78 (+),score=46.20 EC821594.1:271-504(+)